MNCNRSRMPTFALVHMHDSVTRIAPRLLYLSSCHHDAAVVFSSIELLQCRKLVSDSYQLRCG